MTETIKDGDERVNGTLRKRGGFIHSCWVSHTHIETHSTHDSPMAAASYGVLTQLLLKTHLKALNDTLIAVFLSGQGTLLQLQQRADDTARQELRR